MFISKSRMARLLVLGRGANRASLNLNSFTTGWFGMVAGFIVCVFAMLACASHGRWKVRRFFSIRKHEHNPAISINQVQPGVLGEACIWQRSIIFGEKCQLPEFSGVITYDTAGRLVSPAMASGSSIATPAPTVWRK